MKKLHVSIMRKCLIFLALWLSSAINVMGQEIGDIIDNGTYRAQITSLSPRECKLTYINGGDIYGNSFTQLPSYMRYSLPTGGSSDFAVTAIGSKVVQGYHQNHKPTCRFEIPNTVRIIEDNAFYDINIQELIIPSSVKHFDKSALNKTSGYMYVLDRSGKLPPPDDFEQYKDAYVVTTAGNSESLRFSQDRKGFAEYKNLSFIGLTTWETKQFAHQYEHEFFKCPINKAYIEADDKFYLTMSSIPSIPQIEIIEGEDVIELKSTYTVKASEADLISKYNDEKLLKYDAAEMTAYFKVLKKGSAKLKIYNEIGDTIYFPVYVIDKYPTSITIPKELEVPINTKTEIAVTTTPEDATCGLIWQIINNPSKKVECTIDEHNVFYATTPGNVSISASFPRKGFENSFINSNRCDIYVYDNSQLVIDELKGQESDTITVYRNGRILLHPKYLCGKSTIPVTFEINDKSVAIADDEGYLCGINKGTTQVIIRSTENPNLFKTFVLKVDVLPEKIEIDIPDQLITVGDTIKIKYRVLPEDATDKSVKWWVHDPDMLKMLDNEGNFVATQSGRASVSIKLGCDKGKYEYEKVDLKIYSPVTSISFDSKTQITTQQGWRSDLKFNVFPATNTLYSVNVTAENPGIIEIIKHAGGSFEYKAKELGKSGIILEITDHKDNTFTQKIDVYSYSIDWEYDEQYSYLATGDSIQVAMNLSPSIMFDDFPNLGFRYSDPLIYGVTVDYYSGVVKTSKEGTYEIRGSGTLDTKKLYAEYLSCEKKLQINVFDPIIKFDKNNCSISCDETVKINKECFPYDFIDGEWSVTDGEVATVDQEGNVRGLAPGICDITYRGKTKGGVLVENSCRLEVKDIIISSLELSETNITLEIGNTKQLSATISPDNATDKNLLWRSSDENVATVDENGIVTAVKPGTAIITATTSNELAATCEVTVLPILVDEIILNPNEIQGLVGETFTIEATILPENASEPMIKWESTSPMVATVNQEGSVEVHKEGTCRIIASATDSSNVSAECIITGVSGIESIFANGSERIYVYTPEGILIKKDCSSDDLKNLVPGIYIITTETKTIKVILR